MQSEQQQRIMGYFIEEAKDHLNTIEQGLLSLQSTMEDKELLNEIFRAAHSVKGGAAMLGINSIQQTAHRLEDCFKILQESPVRADHQLESLFLQVFDTLQALVEQLQSPFGLTDEAASEIMSDAESVFEELNAHLEMLVKQAEGSSVATVVAPKVALANPQMNTGNNSKTLPANFKRDVLIELREMLHLFKQQDSPEHRNALQTHCRNLTRLGEQLDLPGWGELLETARSAIASSSNSYRLLANVVIKEIKQAQELVVAGRSVEIRTNEQLKALAPKSSALESQTESDSLESETDLTFNPDVEPNADLAAQANNDLVDESDSSLTHLFDSPATDEPSEFEDFIPETVPHNSPNQSFAQPEPQKNRRIYRFAAPSEPEVGMAELNTLADIFEGQTPDLEETWQEEEIISLDAPASATHSANLFSFEANNDFSDLVSEPNHSQSHFGVSNSNELMDLFGEEPLEESIPGEPQAVGSHAIAADIEASLSTTEEDEFSDLLFEADHPDPLLASSSASDDLSSLFGDSFFTENSPLEDDFNDFAFEAESTSPLQQQDDDLLAMPEGDVFEEAPEMFESITDSSTAQADTRPESLGWEELTFDESVSAFDVDTHTDWTENQIQASTSADTLPAELTLDNSFFETSTHDISDREPISDLGLEDLVIPHESSGSDDWNWDAGNELALDDSAAFDLEGDFTPRPHTNPMPESVWDLDGRGTANTAPDLSTLAQSTVEGSLGDVSELTFDDFDVAGWDTTSAASDGDFDLDLDATSASLFNDEVQINGDIDNLFEDEALPSSEASQSAALESLEAFAELLEVPTAEPETRQNEELDFSAFEEPEASSDFDAFNDFFDAGEASETAASGVDIDAPLEVENTFDFDDLSIFDTAEASDSSDDLSIFDTAEASDSSDDLSIFDTDEASDSSDDLSIFDTDEASDSSDDLSIFDTAVVSDSPEGTSPLTTEDEAFADLLFEPSTLQTQQDVDLGDALSDTNEGDLFDLDGSEALFAEATSPALEPSLASDDLFGDELIEDTDTLDWSSFAEESDLTHTLQADALHVEADLFADESPSPEWAFEAEEDATDDAQALLFEGDEAEAVLGSLDVSAPEAPSADAASDWNELMSDDLFAETESVDVSAETLFETESATHEEQQPANEATTFDLLDLDLDGEGAGAVEVDNLDEFLTTETDEVADAQNWDALLSLTPDAQEPNVDMDTLFEGLDVQTTENEAASLFDLDWEEQSNSLLEDAPEESPASSSLSLDFDDLEAMLAQSETLTDSSLSPAQTLSESSQLDGLDEFADLEAMLADAAPTPVAASSDLDVFQDLDALLEEEKPAAAPTSAPAKRGTLDAEFGDLQSLLEQTEKTMGGAPATLPDQGRTRPLMRPRPTRVFEHTMRVPVKHLDSLSNLVGELVVNRNTLEQDQERLRQFLDNLSHQVLALSDVGARMQDLYERSLLESSLLRSRQSHRSFDHSDGSSSHSSGVEYDPLEMDRFTGFHLLSQEMIELIVRVRESASDIEFLVDETDQVARMLRQITTQLQEGLTRARMVPFAQNADRLLRAVHEISRKLGKEAQLQVEGRETLIDKMILEHLYDPMTHLVNNALTHGIELPEVRKGAGKPRVGKVTLRAFHQGNQTVISISDDGAGIDPERVRAKAIEQKLISASEAKKLTNIELYDFLFHPGFSTKDKADDFAGRGVGMDVVRTSLSECRGTIQIDSAVGKGTTFTIRLPLTLSICKALCCLSDRASIAFPMDGVEDAFDLSVDRVQMNSDGHKCIPWRDGLLPFHPLSELLTYKRQLGRNAVYGGKREDDMISIIVLRSAGNFLAIQVDKVLGEQEIVIKQLEGPPPKPVGIAGATVLGDGRIMAIADVLELIDVANGRIRKDGGVAIWPREDIQADLPQEQPEVKNEPMVLIVDDSITVRELLSMTFNKAGYRVEQARDGQEAWEKLRSGLPCDIVFCDIEMPRMDGLELLSRLQKDEKLCHLPIAMLTSRGADRHRQMASQLGASGYFTKPYLEEVLLDAAQRMIKGEVLFSSNSNA